MFTGLVEECGKFHSLKADSLRISCSEIPSKVELGDSVAVNGVCLTVRTKGADFLDFNVSPVTQRHSRFNHSQMRPGEKVNLERALTLESPLGGHLVSGHIDATVRLIAQRKDGSYHYFEIELPENIKYLVAEKGSVALDGISLTVSLLRSRSFEVAIIPTTMEKTNLGRLHPGDQLHLEVDMLARYLARIIQQRR